MEQPLALNYLQHHWKSEKKEMSQLGQCWIWLLQTLPDITKMKNKGSSFSHHKPQQSKRTCPQSELSVSHQSCAMSAQRQWPQVAQGHLLLGLCFLANALGSNVLCLSSGEQKCLLQPCQLRCHNSSSSPSSLIIAALSLWHKPESQQDVVMLAV